MRVCMHVYNIDHGRQLVKAARNSIELFLIDPNFDREIVRNTLHEFKMRHGVFVTLEHYPTRVLRGQMGFPNAIAPLNESVVDAAIAAAFEDTKFVSVSKPELDELIVEVSIMSSPIHLNGGAHARLNGIKIPGDGIMIEYGLRRGLILPMVPVEKKWSKKRSLEEACKKAGIHANHWMQPKVRLYRFEAQVFREESPNGDIVEVKYVKDK